MEDGETETAAAAEIDSTRFNELFASVQPNQSDAFSSDLLSHASITAFLGGACSCLVPCPIRAGLSYLQVYSSRHATLQKSLTNGDRAAFVADLLRCSLCEEASHHPAESTLGPRILGQRSRRQHFVLSNIDVCGPMYASAIGVSVYVLRTAGEQAKGPPRSTAGSSSTELIRAQLCNSDIADLHAVQFLLDYARDSGAEKIPMSEDLERARKFQSRLGSVDDLCLLRVNDDKIGQVYAKYVEHGLGGRRYFCIGIREFSAIFDKDPRVAHICLARKRDSFSICTTCGDSKQLLSTKLTREQRAAAQYTWACHLDLVWAERMVYSQRAQAPFVESIPPVLHIRMALSIHIDKQTKNMTAVPAMYPWPKCASSADRLFINLTSVVVHGVGYYTFLSNDAQSSGCDLTIEVLHRLLVCLQSHGYLFDNTFHIQADHHTDNKTPAVLFFAAYLVHIGAFHVVLLAFLLVGHGHLCADQRHANNALAIRRKGEFPISPLRFRDTILRAFRSEAKKPTIVEVDGVRRWSVWLSPAMKEVGFERLAMSQDSGESQCEYKMSRHDGSGGSFVGLTYKHFASSPEVYPRLRNVGSIVRSDEHGAGSVVDSSWIPEVSMWRSTVSYHNGHTETFNDPVQPINMFPNPALIPEGAPEFEAMAADWPSTVSRIRSNVSRCIEHLAIFSGAIPGVQQDWEQYFQKEDISIAFCISNPGASYYQGPSVLTSIAPTLAPVNVVTPPQSRPPPALPSYSIDPVVHSTFTTADRATLQRQEKISLVAGTLVALRLKFGASLPLHHKLPICLAYVPGSYVAEAHPDGGLVPFEVIFARGSDLPTAIWTVRDASNTLSAPLRSVLVSSIELTAARKITAVCLRKISALVHPYELSS